MLEIEHVAIADITLCPANAEIFPDSTSDEEIAKLAEDIKKRGQQYPVQLCHTTHPETGEPCIMPPDGHRRIMALAHNGETHVMAIDVGEMTYDEVVSAIVDSSTSARILSPRERYNLFKTAHELLKRTRGGKQGRKKAGKEINLNEIYFSELKALAAKKAGISRGMADRLEKVFEQASDDIIAKVASGQVSVSAAYDQLPKRPKKTKEVEATKEAVIEDTKEEVEEESNVADNPFVDDEPNQVDGAPKEAESEDPEEDNTEESSEQDDPEEKEDEDPITVEQVIEVIDDNPPVSGKLPPELT